MLHLIKACLLGTDTKRRLTENPPDLAVAVCAVLIEAAEADHDFTTQERSLIKTQLRKRFNLDEAAVENLMQETQAQRAAAADAWPFTHAIRLQYTPEQKHELLVLIWQILLSDEKLTDTELQWARRLQEMLAVNQSLLIDAKQRARQIVAGLATASA
jgi:uncharacterized tellurite resistance protein B-like protein